MVRAPLVLNAPDLALIAEAEAPGRWTAALRLRDGRLCALRFVADARGCALDLAGPVGSLAELEGALARATVREGPGAYSLSATDREALRGAALAEPGSLGVYRKLGPAPGPSAALPLSLTLCAEGAESLGAARIGPARWSVVLGLGDRGAMLARFAGTFGANGAVLDLIGPAASPRALEGLLCGSRLAREGQGAREVYATDREAIAAAALVSQRRERGLSDHEAAQRSAPSPIHSRPY
ncbi:MAG: hypothetical protein AB7N76_09570 [Planctomycetota bacterium]